MKELQNELKTKTFNDNLNLIVAIINRGFADYVVEAARDAGASGATILYGRSSTIKDESFMGIKLNPEKEIVLILTKKNMCSKIMQEIMDRTSLSDKGNGICFSMPVNKTAESSEKQ